MELREDVNSHKLTIESLVIDHSVTSQSDDDVAFSEDYIDSPPLSATKLDAGSSSDGCGSCRSDDQSSLGTVEADDDTQGE